VLDDKRLGLCDDSQKPSLINSVRRRVIGAEMVDRPDVGRSKILPKPSSHQVLESSVVSPVH
jgi:hypothetical protein